MAYPLIPQPCTGHHRARDTARTDARVDAAHASTSGQLRALARAADGMRAATVRVPDTA